MGYNRRMSERPEITVQDNPDRRRYEATTDGGVVSGFADYRDRDGVRVFVHTEVDDAFGGQGVGSTLARGALDDVRARGLSIRAECEFIQGYLAKHPEYADLAA